MRHPAIKISTTLCAVFVLLAVLNANAASGGTMIPGYPDEIEAYDVREVAMLPAYCKHTQLFRVRVPGGNNSAEIKRWSELLGPTFSAMHHYCWGLMKTNRAVILARTKQARTFYLSSAVKEFDYVLERAPADFVLLPEILTKKGENLIRLGRGALAIKELEHAIETKPDYWPPYVTLSNYYKKSGDVAKARELLQKALSFSPDNKSLKTQLAELESGKGSQNPRPRKPTDGQ
jgi:hypothetical protein